VRLVPGIVTIAVLGSAFGAATSLVNNVPTMLGEVGQAHSDDSVATWIAIFLSLILDSGWAWAALGFALGWLTGPPVRLVHAVLIGAVAGAAGLSLATASYFATDLLFGISDTWPTVSYWLIRAVILGPPLGAAGTLARRSDVVGFFAGLTIPVGAAMSMLLFPLRTGRPGESSAAAYAEASVWAAAAVGAAAVTLRFVRAQRWLRSRRHHLLVRTSGAMADTARNGPVSQQAKDLSPFGEDQAL
jgi:Family of unknown function (DUF6518)